MGTAYRAFQAGDELSYADPWNTVMHRDAISLEHFVRQTLLDVNVSPEGLWLAEDDGRLVGFLLSRAPGVARLFAPPTGTGRLSGIGVLEEYKNRGIEKALLDRMRQKGYRFAWFGETGPQRKYHKGVGFTVQRIYALLSKDL